MYTCTDEDTKVRNVDTERERGSEIFVLERIQSVAYLYQLCPGLVIQSQIAARLSASRHLKHPGRNVRARDSVITCCVGGFWAAFLSSTSKYRSLVSLLHPLPGLCIRAR